MEKQGSLVQEPSCNRLVKPTDTDGPKEYWTIGQTDTNEPSDTNGHQRTNGIPDHWTNRHQRTKGHQRTNALKHQRRKLHVEMRLCI